MFDSWLDWSEPLSLLIALGIDAWYGDPVALYRKVPHPVVVIGKVIAFADRHCNRESDAPRRRRNAGIALVVALVAAALAIGGLVQALLLALPLGWLWLSVAMSALIAQRSLYGHVADVARACSISVATVKRRVLSAERRFTALLPSEPSLRDWAEGGAS